MKNHPVDPRDIPIEKLFPNLEPARRQEMKDFLDDYAEIAWRVWLRLEGEGWKPPRDARIVADIIVRDPKENRS